MDQSTPVSIENIISNTSFGIIQVDIEGKIIYANQPAFDILEIKPGKFLGVPYFNVQRRKINEDFIELTKEDQPLFHVLSKQETVKNFVQGTVINDKIKWFSISASPMYSKTGEFIGGLSSFTDITEQIIIQHKYKENAERNRLLIENVQAVFWEAEIGSLNFSYVSPMAVEMFGYPISFWMKDRFWESIIFEEDRERIISQDRGGKFQSKKYELEYRVVRKDNSVIWVRDLVEIVNENEKKEKLRGLLVNITDQKNVERNLKSSESRYKELIAEAPYAVTIYNRKGLLIAANEKCAETWLIDREEWIGSYNILEDQDLKNQGFEKPLNEAFLGQKNEFSTELVLSKTSGDKKHLHIKYYPLFDGKGEVENVIFIAEDVTDYIRAKEKATTGESLKQGILDALDEGILVVDGDGVAISLNKSLIRYASNQTHPLPTVGMSVYDFFEFFEEDVFLKKGLDNILNKSSTSFDYELKLSDDRWYGMRITQLENPFGAVISWQNINTRKEIELALEKSLKKYRSIYNTAPVMMHSVGVDKKIISVSNFWLGKMEYDRNEVIGQSPSKFMTEDSKKRFSNNIKKLFKTGSITNASYQLVKKSGAIIDVILSAIIEYDENGKFERTIAGITDVTELKAIERELVESKQNLLESQRLSKIGNYEFNVKEGSFITSSVMDRMMGLDSSDRNINGLQKLVIESDSQSFMNKLDISIKTGRNFFHVYRIKHLKNGKLKWISGRGKMIKDENGEIVKMIGTVQDITEQKLSEEKIRRLTDRILLATEIAGIGVWEFDRAKNEIIWEEQMYAIFGNRKPISDPDEMRSILHEEDRDTVYELLQKIKDGVNFLEVEFRVIIDNEVKYLRSFTRVLRDQDGHLLGMIGVFYDNTRDKQLQHELEDSLDEKNVLIKEVHHRVKNNMQLVSSILALKSYELKDEDSKKVFAEVHDRIKAMSIIHDKLYTFYNVSEINIAEYLNSIGEELRILFGSENISFSIQSEEFIFDVDKALTIGLIISELVSNAYKHSFKNQKTGTVSISFTKKDDKYCLLIYNDGDKIPENALKITSGLGMSLIKTFVRQLLGTISVDDKNGFKVEF